MTKVGQFTFITVIRDLYRLFFPDLCICCLHPTPSASDPLCIHCLVDLPYTNFHLQMDNPLTERFFGRIPIHSGTAFLYFEKKGRVQQMVHALKYNNRPDLGIELGKMFGEVLRLAPYADSLDGILAIPLHGRRLRERGYNQSAMLAKGIASVLGIPFFEEAIIRKEHTISQTKKTRMERFRNVEKVFELSGKRDIRHQHLLLVDDVLTTGATLEACGAVLLKEEGVKLSVATLAIAEN